MVRLARSTTAACAALSCLLLCLAAGTVRAMLPHLDTVEDESVLNVEVAAGSAELATVVKLFVNAHGDGEKWSYRVEVFQPNGAPRPESVLIVRRLKQKEELLRHQCM